MEVTAKVFAIGNSNAIRIPRLIMKNLSLNANDYVNMRLTDNNELIIRKKFKNEGYPSIKEIFKGYSGDYVPEEFAPNDRRGTEMV
ncbi:MAG: AbrB/MazE/SpoVT family DNA-binding domain-containing protein [Selenomonadaceae bacterium]|nr:AbrB/MazE/SpoVT family DNA-binding domain-containing protein [Selenomonadaceae bacterium]